jgi:hypothetical protein
MALLATRLSRTSEEQRNRADRWRGRKDVGQSHGSMRAFINWLTFPTKRAAVTDVSRIRNHPLVPRSIPIYGYVHVRSGKLIEVPEQPRSARPRPDASSSYGGDLQVRRFATWLPSRSLLTLGAMRVAVGSSRPAKVGCQEEEEEARVLRIRRFGIPVRTSWGRRRCRVGGLTLKLDRTKWGHHV